MVLTIDRFVGFFGPLAFGFEEPVIELILDDFRLRLLPPLRLVSNADASVFFGDFVRLLRLSDDERELFDLDFLDLDESFLDELPFRFLARVGRRIFFLLDSCLAFSKVCSTGIASFVLTANLLVAVGFSTVFATIDVVFTEG